MALRPRARSARFRALRGREDSVMHTYRPVIIAVVLALSLPLLSAPAALAVPPGNVAFERTWARTDRPVATGMASRTWMWGPEANTVQGPEEYAQAPGGMRTVQYFDKSRMEDNSYRATT